jgi:hypothetical protein
MAKGQNLTRYQRGIVKRYYANLDTLTLQKLQETVSDLYLAEPKAAAKLWDKTGQLLAKAGIEPPHIEQSVGKRDIKELARLVGELAAKK